MIIKKIAIVKIYVYLVNNILDWWGNGIRKKKWGQTFIELYCDFCVPTKLNSIYNGYNIPGSW